MSAKDSSRKIQLSCNSITFLSPSIKPETTALISRMEWSAWPLIQNPELFTSSLWPLTGKDAANFFSRCDTLEQSKTYRAEINQITFFVDFFPSQLLHYVPARYLLAKNCPWNWLERSRHKESVWGRARTAGTSTWRPWPRPLSPNSTQRRTNKSKWNDNRK